MDTFPATLLVRKTFQTHTPCSPSQHIRDDASYSKVEEESRRSIHLIDCMQLFTEEKMLEKDDSWLAHTHTLRVHSFLASSFTVNQKVLPRVQGACASLQEV